MQRRILVLVLFSALSFSSTRIINFENNWARNPLFTVVSQNRGGVELVFSMHQLVREDQVIDGEVMSCYGVPGVFIARPGAPNLTGAARYLVLPQGAEARVEIIDARTEVYHNVLVAPAPNIPRENDDSPLRYEKDMAIYGKDAYWPESPVRLSGRKRIRGVDVVVVGVIPFQYNPVKKELIVYKDIRFRVNFVGGNGHFGVDRLRNRFWEPILQGHLLNYNSLPKIDFYAPERISARAGYEYIIIVPDDPVFEAWGDTIKAWRKLQGISTEVFTLTEVGGSSATDIENFLNNAYNTWDPAPVAFLLLSDYPESGDVYGITSPVWNSYCVSDHIYADVDGDDIADMYYGRICAQNESHLSIMINKFLSYERSPYTAPNFYDEPLVAGAFQWERWFQLCNEVVRGFMVNGLGKHPVHQYGLYSGNPDPLGPWSTRQGTRPTVQYWYNLGWLPDTLNPYGYKWWNNGSAAGINNAINSGAFLVQHRDHGWLYGWGEPAYDTTDLDNLINTMFPYVLSICCLTGKYDYINQVFAEKFHRMEYGCLGINAATEINYSFVSDTYTWGIFDGLWDEFDPGYPAFDLPGHRNLRPCEATTYGKLYLEMMWFPDSAGVGQYRNYIHYLFQHFGDCFTTLYSEIPQELSVSHLPTLPAGQTYFTVSADDSSIIALTVDGEIIGVAEGTGSPLQITIPGQSAGEIVKVTVTKANYYRYESDVQVIGDQSWVSIDSIYINDSLGGNNNHKVNPGETIDLGVRVRNYGPVQSDPIYGYLTGSDPFVVLNTDSSWYGAIPANDTALSNPFYNFSVADTCPNHHIIHFALEFHNLSDSVWIDSFNITVYAPILQFVDFSVLNDDNGNHILEPGETADLVVTIKNIGGASTGNVSSTLFSFNPYITVNDGSGNYGPIAPDSSANNLADPYNVTASSSAPYDSRIDFQIELVSGVYINTLDFSMVLGRMHYYIWNPDFTPRSGLAIDSILNELGYVGHYGTTLAQDLSLYKTVFVCAGIYPNNFVILDGSPEANALTSYLQDQGGRVYLEGGDVWYYDPQHAGGYDFGPLFGISANYDGEVDMHSVAGEQNTFTEGMDFSYNGENEWTDHIQPDSTNSFLIFEEGYYNYGCGVARVQGSSRTVGISFELGGLVDATPPSTRASLLDSIMHFFGVYYGVGERPSSGLYPATILNTIYPNPCLHSVTIRYQIAPQDREKSPSLSIYDVQGRRIKYFRQLSRRPVNYIIWDGKDETGRSVSCGVYFVRFEIGNYRKSTKIIFLR